VTPHRNQQRRLELANNHIAGSRLRCPSGFALIKCETLLTWPIADNMLQREASSILILQRNAVMKESFAAIDTTNNK
jgi:hypothetical protein